LDIPTLHSRSPLLVTSVFSLSALYLSTDEVIADFGYDTPSVLSEHYARVAKSHACGLYDEPSSKWGLFYISSAMLMNLSVHTIQAFLILSIRELLIWSNVKAYMYAGIALRMAQALYLNVEVRQRYSPRQKEIRRRTFWACFVVDRLISYSCNKSFTLSFDSAHVYLPSPEVAFAFDEVLTGLTVERLSLQANQVSQIGIMPYFIAMVRLWGDMALLHVSGGRRLSKHGPHSPESEFYQNEKAIETFSSSLPPTLIWSTQNYKLHQVTGQTAKAYVNLNFLLHHSRCVMHQEYLPQLDSQFSLGSDLDNATVFDAAGISLDHNDVTMTKSCIHSIDVITDIALALNAGSEQDRELLQSIFAANAILTAAAVHLWVLYTQTCDACPKHVALAKAEQLRRVIKSWQPRWRVATAWVETLEMLYKLYVYSYGKIVDSDLDCWDMGADDIRDGSEVSGEATDESICSPATDADGMPDPSAVCQRLYDKIRSILVNPLLATEIKNRNLRIYARTLWQHMWILGPTEGFDDEFLNLENVMDPSVSGLASMPILDLDLDIFS
jgi:Fungal specific transcription factor domain